jgi:HAD superfamily hydrolase (TIGR01490 family)
MLRAMDTPSGGLPGGAAAFFDLDKTQISRSSTLAFVPSFHRHGLISHAQAARGAIAQLAFRASGADHDRMERIKDQVSSLCRGWSVERVTEIVTANLAAVIAPIIYAEARGLLKAHKAAGRDVFIVSTSGLEMVGPIGTMLGASGVIATQMRHANGRYTGELRRAALDRDWPVLTFAGSAGQSAGRAGQTCEQQVR